jgi:hypothetical protein
MITLNLIPESIREENRLKHVYRLNVKFGLIILYILIIVGVLVQVSKNIVVSGFDTVMTQSEIITKNSKAYNERARDINSKISLVGQVVQDNHDWNGLILGIARLLPPGITLYHLYLNQESKSIRIAGMAETRDDLLMLKDVIDKSGYIKPVKLPMSNILEKKDISFDLESKFDYAILGKK